jgi:hypothetical protein
MSAVLTGALVAVAGVALGIVIVRVGRWALRARAARSADFRIAKGRSPDGVAPTEVEGRPPSGPDGPVVGEDSPQRGPELGDVRFDGVSDLETFDGTSWIPLESVSDEEPAAVFREAVQADATAESGDGAAFELDDTGAFVLPQDLQSGESADSPPTAESRYANAAIASGETGELWPRDRPLGPGVLLLLRVSIGPLAADNQVDEPVPFPEEYLPGGDLVIDVAVSSATFTVGRDPTAVPDGHAEEDQFVLPSDGSPARTSDGGTELTFILMTPRDPGAARLRLVYYYRGAVVQSQLLSAEIGGSGAWSLVTDYTIAASLPRAADIPERARVAVVINGDGVGHEIYVRSHGGVGGQLATITMELPPAIGDHVRDFRRVLASEAVAPTTAQRSRLQLITSLRSLAPLGWELYAAVFPRLKDALYQLDEQASAAVLHVARPTGVSLSVPWALLYTIGIDSSYGPGYQSVPVCPLVSDWDGHSPLVSEEARACPRAADVPHVSNLLCPFGFLGLCHDIEQLSRTECPVICISAAAGSSVVVAETAYQVSQRALQQHVTGLRHTISARLPGVDVHEAAGKAALNELISRDLPLIYFYCHGERPAAASRETYLGIGNREYLTAADFVSWVQTAYFSRHVRVWDQIRPLVFINACHSAELDPKALFNYVDAFVGAGNAAGVIGTEVKVQQDLAMEFAQRFFDELLTQGSTVALALHRARLAFLAKGNLFGLNYTPYCWADLTVTS